MLQLFQRFLHKDLCTTTAYGERGKSVKTANSYSRKPSRAVAEQASLDRSVFVRRT
jgi:hypothetical protein